MTIEWNPDARIRIVDVDGTPMISTDGSERIPLSDFLIAHAMETIDNCTRSDGCSVPEGSSAEPVPEKAE